MQRWLIIAGVLPLCAAGTANAQPLGIVPVDPSETIKTHGRTVNLRITREITAEPFPRIATGIVADTEVMRNGRLGVGLVTTERRFGSDLPVSGRPNRSRKPAVTFVLKF